MGFDKYIESCTHHLSTIKKCDFLNLVTMASYVDWISNDKQVLNSYSEYHWDMDCFFFFNLLDLM